MLKKLFRTINEIADPSLRFSHYLSVIKVCKIKPKVNEISKEFFVRAYECSTLIKDPNETQMKNLKCNLVYVLKPIQVF